jgi:hypothetical protein
MHEGPQLVVHDLKATHAKLLERGVTVFNIQVYN